MPLKFTDLSQFLTPMPQIGTGAAAINAATSNILQSRHQDEMRRYHDMLAEQERRRIEQAQAGLEQAAINQRNKLAADILKEKLKAQQADQQFKQSTLIKAQERALVDPQGAQAILASAGMLVPPSPPAPPARQPSPPPQQAPQPAAGLKLPQAAIDAGIDPNQIMADIEPLRQAKMAGMSAPVPGPSPAPPPVAEPISPPPPDFSYQVGNQTFGYRHEQEMAQRVDPIKKLFETNLQFEEKPDLEIAQKTLALAPDAVRAMPDASPKEVTDFLMAQYNKDKAYKLGIAKLEAQKKKKRSGRGRGGVGDPRLYAMFDTKARMVIKDLGFFEADEAISDLAASHRDIMSNNGTRQWNAIRRMIKTYESGKLSDFDVKMAKGYMSLWEEASNWFSEHAGGELSPDIQKKIAESIVVSGAEMHKQLKNRIAVPIHNKATTSDVKEERAAYRNFYNSMFDKKTYSWFKPIGERQGSPVDLDIGNVKIERPTTTIGEIKIGGTTDRESLLNRLEEKHGR